MATSREAELRAELGNLLRAVGAEPPVEARELCRLVGAHLGKPINLAGRPIPTASGAGAAMAVGEGYLVLYQAATDRVHQTHIILHELVHIVRGHLDRETTSDLTCRFTDVGDSPEPTDPAAQVMEWEAETGAAILGEWNDGDQALWARAGRDRGAFRFGAALQGPFRWT